MKSLRERGVPAASATNPRRDGDAWQLQSAKARFSEVFRRARSEGPQRITRQGKDGVIMVAEEQYDRLVGKSRQPKSLVDFLRNSPLKGVNLERDPDPGRDLDL
jgi:antitoxin Phd